MKQTAITDKDIIQAGSNSYAIYYRICNAITVSSAKNKHGRWTFLCLTCLTTDRCAHTRAVRRYCNHPLHEED